MINWLWLINCQLISQSINLSLKCHGDIHIVCFVRRMDQNPKIFHLLSHKLKNGKFHIWEVGTGQCFAFLPCLKSINQQNIFSSNCNVATQTWTKKGWYCTQSSNMHLGITSPWEVGSTRFYEWITCLGELCHLLQYGNVCWSGDYCIVQGKWLILSDVWNVGSKNLLGQACFCWGS